MIHFDNQEFSKNIFDQIPKSNYYLPRLKHTEAGIRWPVFFVSEGNRGIASRWIRVSYSRFQIRPFFGGFLSESDWNRPPESLTWIDLNIYTLYLDEIVDIIKNDLYKRGYTYDQFLLLDNNMKKGSRQLLVCIGWLIYHIKLIEKCMKQCLNSISNLDQVG